MMYWNGDWGGATAVAMGVGMMVFWVLVVWAVVMLARGSSRPEASSGVDPERTLGERFARGEIDSDEYQDRLAHLRGVGTSTRGDQ